MSGIYIAVGAALSYFFTIGVIELYGRYLLRQDAKKREKLLLQFRSYDESNH